MTVMYQAVAVLVSEYNYLAKRSAGTSWNLILPTFEMQLQIKLWDASCLMT